MKTFLTACLCLCLSLVGLLRPMAVAAAASDPAETLMGVVYDYDKITIQVRTGNCTKKKDFRVDRVPLGTDAYNITLVRIRPDTCEAAPANGLQIEFSFNELGFKRGDYLRLMNPLEAGNILVW